MEIAGEDVLHPRLLFARRSKRVQIRSRAVTRGHVCNPPAFVEGLSQRDMEYDGGGSTDECAGWMQHLQDFGNEQCRSRKAGRNVSRPCEPRLGPCEPRLERLQHINPPAGSNRSVAKGSAGWPLPGGAPAVPAGCVSACTGICG